MKVRSRVGFVLPSLDEERPAGVDCQCEEGEEYTEQLHIGNSSGRLNNVNLDREQKNKTFYQLRFQLFPAMHIGYIDKNVMEQNEIEMKTLE